jgi:hypothetical protein
MRLKSLAVIGLVVIPMLARAECGWLLMVPPTIGDRGNDSAALALWRQHAAYDTAAACEKGLEEIKRRGIVLKWNDSDPSTGDQIAWKSGRCLPASQVPVR